MEAREGKMWVDSIRPLEVGRPKANGNDEERRRKLRAKAPANGICTFDGCITRICEAHLNEGWKYCMLHQRVVAEKGGPRRQGRRS